MCTIFTFKKTVSINVDFNVIYPSGDVWSLHKVQPTSIKQNIKYHRKGRHLVHYERDTPYLRKKIKGFSLTTVLKTIPCVSSEKRNAFTYDTLDTSVLYVRMIKKLKANNKVIL